MRYKIIAKDRNSSSNANDLDQGDIVEIPLEGIPGDFPESVSVELEGSKVVVRIRYFNAEPKIERMKMSNDISLGYGKKTGRIYSFTAEGNNKPFKAWKSIKYDFLKEKKKSNRFKNNRECFEEIILKAIPKARMALRAQP